MDKQPDALRLADALDNADSNFYAESSLWFDRQLCNATRDAAGELRRQHALIAELVEALNLCVVLVSSGNRQGDTAIASAVSALSKAKEQ